MSRLAKNTRSRGLSGTRSWLTGQGPDTRSRGLSGGQKPSKSRQIRQNGSKSVKMGKFRAQKWSIMVKRGQFGQNVSSGRPEMSITAGNDRFWTTSGVKSVALDDTISFWEHGCRVLNRHPLRARPPERPLKPGLFSILLRIIPQGGRYQRC